ncbi:Gfo/Idh/MocA family oxidoreductase [Marivita sp. XM-24bin2]|uniref:Gfo/Idh/MocA family protein n=1 Tax=Marivita sp. XM-24bin2 TaxID=2133951 RepID=UPI000D797282|nr:Gfo/Idh/MocA family oxidoreductase [Marivita sp. XM-24bin2]PWL34128.1 MAG: gfo/Idh/MocA family oxidoreductase [Marivita sp. XM-24bin2]
MTAPLPLTIIGAGSIGQRHIGVAQDSPAVDVVAIVEPDETRRGDLAQRGLPMVAHLEAVPPETRAAIIATPTPDHWQITMDCLDQGWAVLVEKPTAHTVDAAQSLVDAATARGLPFFTGHHRRCHPFTIAARDHLRDIGDLVGVQGLWSLRKHASYYNAEWRRKPGAGPLMTNLSHEVDLLRFLLTDDITEVTTLLSSARRGFEIEDTAAVALRFSDGALGSILISDAGASPWSFESGSYENPAIAGSGEDYLRFTGTEGALSFPSLTRWGPSDADEIEWSKPLQRHAPVPFARIDPILEQLTRFARVADGANVEDDVLCTGADGVKALEITMAAALSGRLGQPVRAGDVPGDFTGV